MVQSGDMAAKLGTLADAKQFFNQVAERRSKRGDKKGATEIAIRLGTLDPEDYEARMRAAQLAQRIRRQGHRAARVQGRGRQAREEGSATPTP